MEAMWEEYYYNFVFLFNYARQEMTAYPDDAGRIVRRPMGLPIPARCDTAWIRTRHYSDTSRTEMQCLRPLATRDPR